METENAIITDYGILRRDDFEPIQAPELDEGETEGFVMGGMS